MGANAVSFTCVPQALQASIQRVGNYLTALEDKVGALEKRTK